MSSSISVTNILSNPPFSEALHSIRSNGYSYTDEQLSDFITGSNRNGLDCYTNNELQSLLTDTRSIHEKYYQTAKGYEGPRIAWVTVGAPGAGKTTRIIEMIQSNEIPNHIPYVDPDDALKMMYRTYIQQLQTDQQAHGKSKQEACKNAYGNWQAGSNAVAHSFLPKAIEEGISHIFGTTSTSQTAELYFRLLKERGFIIKLVYVGAPDSVRWDSIKERDKDCVQSHEVDVLNKGKRLPLKTDIYFKYADEISFFFRDRVESRAMPVAKWTKLNDDTGAGKLSVIDRGTFDRFVLNHDNALEKDDLTSHSWSKITEKFIVQE